MASSKQEASFIPKRNPVKKTNRNTPRPVFIGTIIVRVIFFSVLIAALAVFTYQKKLQTTLDSEILSFNNAIASFDESSLQNIMEIDTRIYQTKNRLEHTVSIASIFEAFELATVESVQIKELELERVDDDNILVTSSMKTDSFDSLLFQRGVLERSDKLTVSSIKELELSSKNNEEQGVQTTSASNQKPNLMFKTNLSVATDLVPHVVPGLRSDTSDNLNDNEVTAVEEQEMETETESDEGNQSLNEENI